MNAPAGLDVDMRCGDSLELLDAMPAESVDCIFADPPYGETSLRWDRWPLGWPAKCRRVLKKSGSMWVCGSMRMFFARLDEFDGWRFSHDVIWAKHNGSNFHRDRFRRIHELVLHFYRNDAPWSGVYHAAQFTHDARAKVVRKKDRPAQWHGKRGPNVFVSEDGGPRLMRSVMQVRSEHGRALHPTQKPLDLVEPLLRYACPPGGIVLDPFAGAGTIGIAARRNGMRALLIEGDPKFFEIATHRLGADTAEGRKPDRASAGVGRPRGGPASGSERGGP